MNMRTTKQLSKSSNYDTHIKELKNSIRVLKTKVSMENADTTGFEFGKLPFVQNRMPEIKSKFEILLNKPIDWYETEILLSILDTLMQWKYPSSLTKMHSEKISLFHVELLSKAIFAALDISLSLDLSNEIDAYFTVKEKDYCYREKNTIDTLRLLHKGISTNA